MIYADKSLPSGQATALEAPNLYINLVIRLYHFSGDLLLQFAPSCQPGRYIFRGRCARIPQRPLPGLPGN